MSKTTDRPCCGDCPYWGDDIYADTPDWGTCHRNAPPATDRRVVVEHEDEDEGDRVVAFVEWRRTIDSDWCGDHPGFAPYVDAGGSYRRRGGAKP